MTSPDVFRRRGAPLGSMAWLPRLEVPPHLIVMVFVFLGAIGVGYLLLPDDNERIAMLERDGHHRQALHRLEQRFAGGDRNQRTLFQLQRLYEEKGDLPKARQMLELLAAARPRDANVQRSLVEFYRVTQDEAGYIRALEARLAQRYSQLVCRELIGRYRLTGNYEAEQRTLATCRVRGYRRAEDIVRLAHLVAADGNLAEAAVLLRSVDDRRRLRLDEDRLMLFAALLEAGDAQEAKRRAGIWSRGDRNADLVLQIIDMLVNGQRHDLAMDLAREVGKPGDAISLVVAELLLDRDQIVAARSYLRGWFEKARLSDSELATRTVHAALDAEDPVLAYQAAARFGLARLAQDDLVALAEALSAIDRSTEFQAVQAVIDPDHLSTNALLAAAVEMDQGKPEPARQLLSRVEVKALDDWRLALWARLMTSTGRRATAEQTLREIAAGAAGRSLPRVADAPVPTTGPSGDLPSPVQRPVPPLSPAPPASATSQPGATTRSSAPAPRVVIRKSSSRKYRRKRQRRAIRPAATKLQPAPTSKSLPKQIPFPAPG